MSTLLKLLLTLLLTATAHGATAVVGGLRVNADTSNTNTTSVRVTVSGTTNLNSGVLNATNSVNVGVGGTAAGVLTLRSTNATYAIDQTVTNDGTYVVRYGTTNMLTLAVGAGAGWTGTGTNFLADDGTFKPAAGLNNWSNEGTTNSTLAGIAKPWALEATNYVEVGLGTNAGTLYLNSVSNIWTGSTSLDTNGTWHFFGDVFDDYATGPAFRIDTTSNLVSSAIIDFALAGTPVAEIYRNGYIYAQGLYVSAPFNGASEYMELDPGEDMTLANGTNDIVMEFQTQDGSVTFTHDSTNFFHLVGITSGYTGAGTKALFDDGTYKTAVTASSTTAFTNKDLTDASNTLPGQIGVACSDETTALTTGTGKVTFRMPVAATLTAVRASLTTAQTSGSIFTVDINENGTTVLSTKITIDNGEKTSTTAATPPVISDSALADDSEITVDIDQVGDGTAKGLKVWLIYTY